MKKLILTFILISLFSFHGTIAQTLNYDGMDFINPFIRNPAFINAKNTIQLNFIGSSREGFLSTTENSYSFSSILNTENINSSFLLSYGHESKWYEDKTNFHFGYSYASRISDKLMIFSGVSFHGMKIKNDYSAIGDFTGKRDTEVNGSNLKMGVRLVYKQFNVGFGYRQNLSNNQLDKHEFDQLNKLVTENARYWIYLSNFTQKYSVILYQDFNISSFFTLTPQGFFSWDNGSRGINLGFMADYKRTLGISCVIDDRGYPILFGNVKIIKGISLYTMLLRGNSFPYDKKQGWDLNGQIRLDI